MAPLIFAQADMYSVADPSKYIASQNNRSDGFIIPGGQAAFTHALQLPLLTQLMVILKTHYMLLHTQFVGGQ